MKQFSLLATFFFFFASCHSLGVKEKINKASEKAGEAVGEVAKGVSRGVENSFEVKIEKADHPSLEAIQLGKITLGSKEGTDNVLNVYIIFNKAFSGKLTIKVYDKNGLEMGRTSQEITGKKEDARFVEFNFDKRTNIDSDSKIIME
jgi:hypothetical protein